MADITIVGGGVIGMLSARSLAEAGASVTIVEKQYCGQESSWAGGGILSPLYPWRQADCISELALESCRHYPALAQDLHEKTGIDPEWQQDGLIVHAPDDMQLAVAWAEKYEQTFELIKSNEIVDKSRPCTPEEKDSLWFPQIAHIRNPRLVKALRADLDRRKNIVIHENAPVERINLDRRNRKIINVETRDNTFCSDHFVIATGAWSGEVLSKIAPKVQISPVQGQMLIYSMPTDFLGTVILSKGRYLIPRRDGKILVGSTVNHVGFNKTPDASSRKQLIEFAEQLCPPLKHQTPSHHWAGLRPGTPSGIPYLDKHPEYENLILNCGHFRNGLVMGPASVAITNELLLGRSTGNHIDIAPFKLDQPH